MILYFINRAKWHICVQLPLWQNCLYCTGIRKPRTTGRQRNHANPAVTIVCNYWGIIIYYQFLDHLLNESWDCLLNFKGRFLAQPLNDLKQEDKLQIHHVYVTILSLKKPFPRDPEMESKMGNLSEHSHRHWHWFENCYW